MIPPPFLTSLFEFSVKSVVEMSYYEGFGSPKDICILRIADGYGLWC